jgi:hypothetical protein
MFCTDVIVFYKYYDDDGSMMIRSVQTSYAECIEELCMNPLGPFTRTNLRTMNDLMNMLSYEVIENERDKNRRKMVAYK